MNELLYIDGQLVDLQEGVDITLNYKSNMLTDLSKIVGNNSYTIKLPKTSRNLRIIGGADVPSSVTSFPRVYHSARYFRNGVEIVSDGRAVLLSVGDSIEIALMWGVSSAVFKMAEDGRNINEFPYIDEYVLWEASNSKSAYDGTSEILNTDVRYGLVSGEDMAAIHPSVRSTYIFKLLSKQYGITFDIPSERQSFINSLVIPLLTRNGGYANSFRSAGGVSYSVLTGDYVINQIGDEFSKNFERVTLADSDLVAFKALVDGRLTVRPTFKSMIRDKGVYHGTGHYSEWDIEYLSYYLEEGNALNEDLYVYTEPLQIDLVAGDMFGINLFRAIQTGVGDSFFQFEIGVTTIQIGDKFPIVENLPSITGLDFVKVIASISGMFCVPSADGNVIKFLPFSMLADRSIAVDWSDKLIPYDESNKPRDIRYSLDDFSRRNNMKWAEDDTVNNTSSNGVILVNDETLEYERDAVELPFAATDTQGGKATIRLYDYPNPVDIYDKGEPELQSVEPRILIEKNVGGYSTGTFDGLQWPSLLAKHYSTYQNAVKSPVVITESILLDELSLRDLDMSKPVYLRQYGKYYAIVEVKAPSDGVCECKLLQLED